MRDPPSIEQLADILNAIDEAARDGTRLDALLDRLVRAAGGLFTGAALFQGQAGGPFMLTSVRLCKTSAARSWLRWPLRRLFARMKPCRIFDPFGVHTSALAIPFAYETKQCVVIAPLLGDNEASAFDGLLSVLESVTIPKALGLTRNEIPYTPIEPFVVGFALCDELFERMHSPLRERGWPMQPIANVGQLWHLKRTAVPDIIVVDTAELADPFTALASIHRIVDSVTLRLVALGDDLFIRGHGYGVVDAFLPHDASPEKIFKAFKTLARESLDLRIVQSNEIEKAVDRNAAESLSVVDLAQFGAERAASLMRGWAFCALFDEYGSVHRMEYPASNPAVLSALPNTLLSNSPTFAIRADEAFLGAITDDSREQIALLGLQPLSGASVPIFSSDGRRLGVIVACSRDCFADSAAFDAVDRLGRILARRLGELQSAREFIPEFSRDRSWERFHDRSLAVNVYRSRDCSIPWRYRALGVGNGLLTLGLHDDFAIRDLLAGAAPVNSATVAGALVHLAIPKCFAGAVDFATRSISYAARGFSPPVSLNARRPTGTIEMVRSMTTGVTTLNELERAVICDDGLWRWLQRRECRGEEVAQLLDDESPSGVASIITMGSTR